MTQFACQTITWGPETLEDNYETVLKEVGAIGYQGVETRCGILMKHKEKLKSWVEQTKIEIVAAHLGVTDLQEKSPKAMAEILDTLEGLKVKYVLFSAPKEATAADFREYARLLEQLGKDVRRRGMRICFHNHNWELENECELLSLLTELTNPEHVGLAVDFGWVLQSDVELQTFLTTFQHRIQYVHLKDVLERNWVELGHGRLELPKLIEFLNPLQLPWWTVEQDTTLKSPSESTKLSYEYLVQMVQEKGR